MKLLVSRTGYTGEDGVEVILPAPMVSMAMKMLMKDIGTGDTAIVKPAGLGCRDTLRMEAGMPLYGHELGEDISALAAGIDFALDLDKDQDERGEPYVGAVALKKTRDAGGPPTRLVGLFVEGKRTARAHMRVRNGGARSARSRRRASARRSTARSRWPTSTGTMPRREQSSRLTRARTARRSTPR